MSSGQKAGRGESRLKELMTKAMDKMDGKEGRCAGRALTLESALRPVSVTCAFGHALSFHFFFRKIALDFC